MTSIDVEVAKAFTPLWRPARYKGAWGGRGSGKSHDRATALVLRCVEKKTRAVCIREIQKSLDESVKALIEEKIKAHGLSDKFEVQHNIIKGANGSRIIFQGMQDHTADSIKSLEDYDIAWVEEAQTLSARSLKLLRPTIRKPGSEIWFTWNPRFEDDPVDEFFRGEHPPPDSICVSAVYSDNPWLTPELRLEVEFDRMANADQFDHIWLGDYENITEGAYYSRLITASQTEGRIGDYPYRPDLPLITSWDIGVDDYTAIWFWQIISRTQVNLVDYYEASGEGAEGIVQQAMPDCLADPEAREFWMAEKRMTERRRFSAHYLPHDVAVREWGGGAKTRQMTLMQIGVNPILVGVANGPAERINAMRRLLPICHFNERTTKLGIQRLRRYSRKKNDRTGQYGAPNKDGNDHGADAAGEYAVNCPITPLVKTPKADAGFKDYAAHRPAGSQDLGRV